MAKVNQLPGSFTSISYKIEVTFNPILVVIKAISTHMCDFLDCIYCIKYVANKLLGMLDGNRPQAQLENISSIWEPQLVSK